MSNLQQRVISAVVLAVVVLGLTLLGGLPFRLLCAALAAAIFYEWTRMTRSQTAGALDFLPEALMAVFLVALIFDPSASVLLMLLAVLAAVVAIASTVRGKSQWDAAGFLYAGLSGFSLALLRDGDQPGLFALLFLFAVVWATDILAYFVGRSLGGPKLAPAISPGKTWSGAIGGAVGGVVAAVALAIALGTGRFALLALIAIVLSVVAQAGDLFESWVKRRHGRKDSGAMIPGHGGVMDRVDGLVAAAFVLYLVGWAWASADNPAQGLFAG